jgi:hypothetical protein
VFLVERLTTPVAGASTRFVFALKSIEKEPYPMLIFRSSAATPFPSFPLVVLTKNRRCHPHPTLPGLHPFPSSPFSSSTRINPDNPDPHPHHDNPDRLVRSVQTKRGAEQIFRFIIICMHVAPCIAKTMHKKIKTTYNFERRE